MKITKSFDDILNQDKKKMIANIFCDRCPNCSEERIFGVDKNYKKYGILPYGYKSYAKGIFRLKHMKIDCYKCYTCGTEWESEEYEY